MAAPGRADLVLNDLVSVGASSVIVLEANPRQEFVLTNSSTGGQKITINLGYNVAVANKGMVLSPNQAYGAANAEGFTVYQGVITAIADGAGGQVSVMER